MPGTFGIDTTYGITVAAAETQTVDRDQSVEVSELRGGEAGEIVKASTTHIKRVTVDINAIGNADASLVAIGNVSSPASMEVLTVEQGERVNGRPTVMIKGVAQIGVDDADGGASGGGAGGPSEDTLEVVSVSYSLAQDVKIGFNVDDEMLPGADGHPALRQKTKQVNKLEFSYAGDVPSGLALGSGGASASGLTGGKVLMTSLKDKQEVGKWNTGSASGNHYPAAA